MRIWNSYKEVDTAIETIITIFDETDTLPDILIKTYSTNLQHARRGILARFYEKLAKKAPALLKYFPGKDEEE